MRESHTLDQVVADALVERGFRFRERNHVGLRADPPVIRLRPRGDGAWVVLDVDEVIGTAEDLPKAKICAGELLGRRGSIWVLGMDGLVQSVEEYIPQTIRATNLGPFPKERVGSTPGPSVVPSGAEERVSTSAELELSEPTSATPAQLTAEAMRRMLGRVWVEHHAGCASTWRHRGHGGRVEGGLPHNPCAPPAVAGDRQGGSKPHSRWQAERLVRARCRLCLLRDVIQRISNFPPAVCRSLGLRASLGPLRSRGEETHDVMLIRISGLASISPAGSVRRAEM